MMQALFRGGKRPQCSKLLNGRGGGCRDGLVERQRRRCLGRRSRVRAVRSEPRFNHQMAAPSSARPPTPPMTPPMMAFVVDVLDEEEEEDEDGTVAAAVETVALTPE